jgi:hypothetical protein
VNIGSGNRSALCWIITGVGGATSSPNSNSSSIPIVLRPRPGGTCPLGYHLVSVAVCIKDIAQSAASQTTSAIPTTNATKSLSIPLPAPSQPNATNPTNNEENLHRDIEVL